MTDEDNFDIDIYGDGEGMDEDSKEFYKQENQKTIALREQQQSDQRTRKEHDQTLHSSSEQVDGARDDNEHVTKKLEPEPENKSRPQQGLKRKGDSDERRIDAGATQALMISDLHWWTTEDDIRGWANEADAEDELKDITFSEHKVNGKSKGQAFVEFTTPQASTATKRKIQSLSSGPNNSRKFSVVFTNASSNPFKTLPKDAPARTKDDRSQRSTSSSYTAPAHHNNGYNASNNFRGNRGAGFGGRGGYHQNYNNNNHRNFSSGGNMGGFNGSPGFQGGMPMMNTFNNFGGRGAMMGNNMRGNMGGIRGGGAMTNNMMPMGMMGMGMGMGMNPMMAGINPQAFGGGPASNNGMFGQNANHNMNNTDWGHGAKRQRQD